MFSSEKANPYSFRTPAEEQKHQRENPQESDSAAQIAEMLRVKADPLLEEKFRTNPHTSQYDRQGLDSLKLPPVE